MINMIILLLVVWEILKNSYMIDLMNNYNKKQYHYMILLMEKIMV